MKSKKKILFVLLNLNGGGTERMILNLCNNLNSEKFDITLCLFSTTGEYINQISSKVKLIGLNINKSQLFVMKFFKYFYLLNKVIKDIKPSIVISSITQVNLFMSIFAFFYRKKIRFIARESNILSLITETEPLHRKIMYKWLYRFFDTIIAQSQDMKDDLLKNYSIKSHKIVVINNFIDNNIIEKKCENLPSTTLFPSDCINLLTVGRLDYQKGFDLLIETFAKVADKKNLHLTILGKGPLENVLKKQITNLNMSKYITMQGFSDNPYQYMKKADVFISSSRFEGFPNVVIESLFCGLPVIANNYTGGINEILSEKIFGEIIDITSTNQFDLAINNCLNKNRKMISDMCSKKYSKTVILSSYIKLFENK